MILPPELSDLEKKFLIDYSILSESSSISPSEQIMTFLGEVFLTLLGSSLMTNTTFKEINTKYQDSKSEMAFLDLFSRIIEYSEFISVNNPIVLRLRQFFISHKIIESVTVNTDVISTNLDKYSFELKEEPSSTHLCPQLLSIIIEYYPRISMKKKKSGKYYTLPSDAALISLLVVFRFLSRISTHSSDNMIFNLLVGDNTDLPVKTLVNTNIPNEIHILDPACGSGTFIIQIISLLRKLVTIKGSKMRLSVDAVDLDPLPLIVTRLRFFLLELSSFVQYGSSKIQLEINIRNEDFLFGDTEQKFDIIIGNPPFIRHEDIGSTETPNYKKILINKVMKGTDSSIDIDKKSDLYIYFCIEGLNLLKKTGVLGFLTSNAWLEVNYGKTLQQYLIHLLSSNSLAQCDIIYQAGTRLWKQIGINSVVLLATRDIDSNSQAKGIFFSDSSSVLTKINKAELKRSYLFSRETVTPSYRTEFIPISELSSTNKWAGSYLRASKEERTVLKKIILQGVPMHSLAKIQFGIKTGANDFFHLTGIKEKRGQYIDIRSKRGYSGRIENQFLVPLIKSPSEIDNYLVTSKSKNKNWLFYCQKPKDQLKGTFALKYIQWGENEIIPVKQGRKIGLNVQGFASLASISARELWYSINPYPVPQLLWAKSYHDKPGCFMNQDKLYPDQRFYSIYPHNERNIALLFTYLNSSFVWALMEQAGNTNMGLGVLDTNVYWLKTLCIPELTSSAEIEEVENLASELKDATRRGSITSDSVIRKKIDEFFKDLFGLTESEFDIIVDFIKKSLKGRLASNQTVTKDN